jgi:hypothetical protein
LVIASAFWRGLASRWRLRFLCDRRRRFRTASGSTLKLCDPTAKLNSLFRPLVGNLRRAPHGFLKPVNLGAQSKHLLHAGQQHVVRYFWKCASITRNQVNPPPGRVRAEGEKIGWASGRYSE